MQGIARVAVDDARALLVVTFLRPIVLPAQSYLLDAASYSLNGGQRIFPRVIRAQPPPPSSPPQGAAPQVVLMLDRIGDFSVYTLTVSGPDIDPFFASHKLRFRLGCDERFDCRLGAPPLPPAKELPVVIDYLAKDYSSFRQALLDFVPTRPVSWTERSEADMGMMLLELFAYTADNLSYMQDRVASEAFLSTATQRRSVAGHLQLIGHQMDDGVAASTFLRFLVNDAHDLRAGSRVSNRPKTDTEPFIHFETLADARLDPAKNAMALYTWGNDNCCLPSTALNMALKGRHSELKPGDYLLIEDKANRELVRLVAPPEIDLPPFPPQSPPGSPPSEAITIVRWSQATPLQHDYCASEVTVYGNMVVATHGQSMSEQFDIPPTGRQRLRLRLSKAPIVNLDPRVVAVSAPIDTSISSPDPLAQNDVRGISSIKVRIRDELWQQQASLLDFGPDAKVFRVEISDLGEATVVFGQGGTDGADEQFGTRPISRSVEDRITVDYRVGGGALGNVAADTLLDLDPQLGGPWLQSVTNPLRATGGRDLESREHARRIAPGTFKKSVVAVTASDYQVRAEEFAKPGGAKPIQRANASFKWTGSWFTVAVGAEPRGSETLDSPLANELLEHLNARRLAGYDLEVRGPNYVPVELLVEFCAAPGFRSPDVQQGLEQVLSSAALAGGRTGLFRPGNFNFGDNLFVSQIYAAAMSVPGVESLRIARLARLRAKDPDADTRINLSQGFVAVGRDQIIRLDNDRNFPENGVAIVRSREAAR
jgi:hypothetical protein